MALAQTDHLSHCVYPVNHFLATRHFKPPTLFFQPAKGASSMRAAKITGYHIAALPPEPASAEPNPWVIVFKTDEIGTVMLELRQVDAQGRTVTVCRKGPRVLKSGELEGCAKSWAFPVCQGPVIGEWLDELVATGLTRYQLANGVGGRWWIDCILTMTNSFFASSGNHERDNVKTWLRLAWSENGGPASTGELQLGRGTWLESE